MATDLTDNVEARAREEGVSPSTFDQLFWRSRAVHDLHEAFAALERSDRIFSRREFRAGGHSRPTYPAGESFGTLVQGPLWRAKKPRGSLLRI
jgi:hypothetical protein